RSELERSSLLDRRRPRDRNWSGRDCSTAHDLAIGIGAVELARPQTTSRSELERSRLLDRTRPRDRNWSGRACSTAHDLAIGIGAVELARPHTTSRSELERSMISIWKDRGGRPEG